MDFYGNHVTGCECLDDGSSEERWCERHQCVKPAHFRKLCRERPSYFQAYEKGRGPGQRDLKPTSQQPTARGDFWSVLRLAYDARLKQHGHQMRTWDEITELVQKRCMPCRQWTGSGCRLHGCSGRARFMVELMFQWADCPLKTNAQWLAATTIIVKAFERPDCLRRCLASIRARYPEASILVGDDSRQPAELPDNVRSIRLPYDCGVSAGRNRLVAAVDSSHVLIVDDDMVLSGRTDIATLWSHLHRGGFDLVAGRTAGKRPPYVGHFLVRGDTLTLARGPVPDSPDCYHAVEQFLLARTDALRRAPWDDRLKTGEHADWAIRAWQAGLRAGYVPSVIVRDESHRGSRAYRQLRGRDKRFHREAMARWARTLGFRHFQHGIFPRYSVRNLVPGPKSDRPR